jgi:hypothetical protein
MLASTLSPSIPLPRGEREAKPLSLDGGVALGQREVGERVAVKQLQQATYQKDLTA